MSPESLLAYRLIRLIETHSEQLAAALLEYTKTSDKTRDYVAKVSPDDLSERVYEIYRHLGRWLQDKSEQELQQRYTEIGALRAHQGIPMSQLIWAITMVKEVLFDFLRTETEPALAAEVLGQLAVLQALNQFFDRAIYYAGVGHEQASARQPQ